MTETIDEKTGEVVTTSSTAVAKPGLKFKVVGQVTFPLFKLGSEPRYLKFDSAPFLGKVIEKNKDMGAPTMAYVTDVETGMKGQVIMGAVLLSSLDEKYGKLGADKKPIPAFNENDEPNPEYTCGYIGRTFMLAQIAPEGTRRYSLFQIAEIELEAEEPAAKTPAPKAAPKAA